VVLESLALGSFADGFGAVGVVAVDSGFFVVVAVAVVAAALLFCSLVVLGVEVDLTSCEAFLESFSFVERSCEAFFVSFSLMAVVVGDGGSALLSLRRKAGALTSSEGDGLSIEITGQIVILPDS